MKRIIIGMTAGLLFGCAGLLPPIQNQHPQGYSLLIQQQPECQSADLKNYSACLTASKILETNTPERVTALFLAHWEETSFGTADRRERIGEARYLPGDAALESSVWGSVKRDQVQATERIVVPALRKIYTDKGTGYSSKMLRQVELIILDSKSSLDSFREAHSDLMKQPPAPQE